MELNYLSDESEEITQSIVDCNNRLLDNEDEEEEDLVIGNMLYDISYELGEDKFYVDIKIGYKVRCEFDYDEEPDVIEDTLMDRFNSCVNFYQKVHGERPFEDIEEEEWFLYKIHKYSKKDYVDKLCKSTICKSSRNV
jgi:hypothetical protein